MPRTAATRVFGFVVIAAVAADLGLGGRLHVLVAVGAFLGILMMRVFVRAARAQRPYKPAFTTGEIRRMLDLSSHRRHLRKKGRYRILLRGDLVSEGIYRGQRGLAWSDRRLVFETEIGRMEIKRLRGYRFEEVA